MLFSEVLMFKFLFISATTILCAVVLASGTSAAPLKNHDSGHFAIEVGGTLPTNLHFSDYGHPKKATSMYGGGTVGLGGKTAVNYRFNQFRTSGSEKITAQQVNLMYKVLPPVSVFAGYLNAKTTVDDATSTSNSGQVGVQTSVDIPLLFTVWGRAGVGNKINSWEIGLAKPLFNNLDFDLSYYDAKFKNLDQGGSAKARGLNLGLSMKF